MARKTVVKKTPAVAARPQRPSAGSASKSSTTTRTKASASVAKPASSAKPGQRALVVGVSGYPAPIPKLPAVAADVRGIAKLLTSRNGTFLNEGVTVLTEKQATRDQVLTALKAAFSGAKADDTVFVYFAGHGGMENGAYYFYAYDTKAERLAETGVPLAQIKRMFDRTGSRRVFLWLDFCHAGGITERGTSGDDIAAIKREISIVQGQGKVILAACTPSQSAYEVSNIGHGLFTHALLRGLKGEARSIHGEVTALSLYEFIDHEVKHPHQQPTFFGQMAGRIVLMHYPVPGRKKPAVPAATKSPSPVKTTSAKAVTTVSASSSGNLVLLDSRIYAARSLNEAGDGRMEVKIAPRGSEEEATLRALRNDRYGGSKEVSFVYKDRAFTGRIEQVTFQSTATRSECTVVISPQEKRYSYMVDVNYNGVTPEQMAEMRARVLLLDEKPSVWDASRDSGLRSHMLHPLEEAGVKSGIFPGLYKAWKGTQADFPKTARLWAVHYLTASGICDEVLELKLGAIRGGKMSVRFRGSRRERHSGAVLYTVQVVGTCQL